MLFPIHQTYSMVKTMLKPKVSYFSVSKIKCLKWIECEC